MFPEEYMNEHVVITKAETYVGGIYAIHDCWIKNVHVRWEDVSIEVPDINDNNTLCVAKVITNEAVEATFSVYNKYPSYAGSTATFERYYIYRNGQKYRVVQHRVYPDIDGNEQYRELLVAHAAF